LEVDGRVVKVAEDTILIITEERDSRNNTLLGGDVLDAGTGSRSIVDGGNEDLDNGGALKRRSTIITNEDVEQVSTVPVSRGLEHEGIGTVVIRIAIVQDDRSVSEEDLTVGRKRGKDNSQSILGLVVRIIQNNEEGQLSVFRGEEAAGQGLDDSRRIVDRSNEVADALYIRRRATIVNGEGVLSVGLESTASIRSRVSVANRDKPNLSRWVGDGVREHSLSDGNTKRTVSGRVMESTLGRDGQNAGKGGEQVLEGTTLQEVEIRLILVRVANDILSGRTLSDDILNGSLTEANSGDGSSQHGVVNSGEALEGNGETTTEVTSQTIDLESLTLHLSSVDVARASALVGEGDLTSGQTDSLTNGGGELVVVSVELERETEAKTSVGVGEEVVPGGTAGSVTAVTVDQDNREDTVSDQGSAHSVNVSLNQGRGHIGGDNNQTTSVLTPLGGGTALGDNGEQGVDLGVTSLSSHVADGLDLTTKEEESVLANLSEVTDDTNSVTVGGDGQTDLGVELGVQERGNQLGLEGTTNLGEPSRGGSNTGAGSTGVNHN